MSEDFLQVRNLLKRGDIGYVTDDTPIALRIRQVGGKAVTSVTVTTATDIVLIDADGTTTSTFATDDTLGKVADRINASANWECKVLDALRSDDSASVLVDGVISVSTTEGISYYDAKLDTSAQQALTYRVTYDRHVGESKPKGAHRVSIKEIKYNADVNAAMQNGVQIWLVDGSVETQKLRRVSVDATETTINWASGQHKLTAPEGKDLVVRIYDSTSLTDATANFLEVSHELE
jgi:predicted lipoprotein with Yx(FWY)xxD motif